MRAFRTSLLSYKLIVIPSCTKHISSCFSFHESSTGACVVAPCLFEALAYSSVNCVLRRSRIHRRAGLAEPSSESQMTSFTCLSWLHGKSSLCKGDSPWHWLCSPLISCDVWHQWGHQVGPAVPTSCPSSRSREVQLYNDLENAIPDLDTDQFKIQDQWEVSLISPFSLCVHMFGGKEWGKRGE